MSQSQLDLLKVEMQWLQLIHWEKLVKNLFEVYQKPIELSWDGTKFGIANSKDGFFNTHVDVTEIILGDKCLNISILQLWMM